MDEHIFHLCVIFTVVYKEHLFSESNKCMFGVTHLKYLSHIIGNGKVKADGSLMSSVIILPETTCDNHVQHFIGFSNYYN